MYDRDLVTSDLNPKDAIKTLKWKRDFNVDNPTYFVGDGLIVYTGPQGSGKTLSAVRYVKRLLKNYPKSKLVTNLMLKDYPVVTINEFLRDYYGVVASVKFADMTPYAQRKIIEDYRVLNRVFPFNDSDDLLRYSNLTEGVIYLIDEIQLYFNSLESKNINIDVMTEVAQQRKQRKHIVATSQVFSRMAKPLREQFSTVVKCNNYFGLIQRNMYLRTEDIETDEDFTDPHGAVDKIELFFHKVEDYESYDTYYKILRNKFVSGEERSQEIYDRISITGSTGSN